MISAPEMKVTILLTYYLLFGLMTSIYTGKTIMDSPAYIDNLYAYLLCQLRGDNPACTKFQEEYFEHQSPHITSTVFILMGLINWINLLFVVQYEDIKHIASKISKLFYHRHARPATKCTFTSDNSTKAYVSNGSVKSTHVETEV